MIGARSFPREKDGRKEALLTSTTSGFLTFCFRSPTPSSLRRRSFFLEIPPFSPPFFFSSSSSESEESRADLAGFSSTKGTSPYHVGEEEEREREREGGEQWKKDDQEG